MRCKKWRISCLTIPKLFWTCGCLYACRQTSCNLYTTSFHITIILFIRFIRIDTHTLFHLIQCGFFFVCFYYICRLFNTLISWKYKKNKNKPNETCRRWSTHHIQMKRSIHKPLIILSSFQYQLMARLKFRISWND